MDPFSENATNLQRKLLFQLVFLNEDENQSVEVEEVEEIDFVELKKRLDEGKSVFITTKENEKIEILNIGEQGADRERRKRGA